MVIRRRLEMEGPAVAFVTTTVNHWVPIFADERIAQVLIKHIGNSNEFYKAKTIGYVVMPSHLHLLSWFKEIQRLSKFMRRLKGLSAREILPLLSDRIRRKVDSKGKNSLWKPRFDDLIITSEKQIRMKLNYIHQNPVKAGLVENEVDFEYSSAGHWLEDKPGHLPVWKGFEFVS